MEIHETKVAPMQEAYQEEAEDMESLRTWTVSLSNKRTKQYEPAKNPFPATPYIVASMEIHEISRLNLGRNKGCNNASSISRRSWGYGEFKNVNPQSVQLAHKTPKTVWSSYQ